MRDRRLVAFGTVMFYLGGIGIVVFDPYPASPCRALAGLVSWRRWI